MSNRTNATYDGSLERTADGGVIRFERRLGYPIREVWDAITNPERLGDWWFPFDADITIDLREGGEMVFAGEGDDGPIRMTLTILRVEPPTLFEHTHADEGSYMRWELEPVGEGTVLRLMHFVPDVDTAIGNCYVVGLHTSLGRLEPVLAGTPIAWDWEQFAESQAHYADMGMAAPVDEEGEA